MKFKVKSVLITLAVVLGMPVFSVSANAVSDKYSVNDNVESKTPLTPGGNMKTVDDVHQVTGKDEIEDKQFITVETKNGNTFYIIIDRSGDRENVYFLNAVDEADLTALMEDEQQAAVTAACTCTEKCELGSVNAGCTVCSKNKDNCTAAAAATPTPDEKGEQQPEKKQNNITPIIGLVLIALLGGGGAFYWFNIKNKKSSTKGTTDPADLYEDEDDEDYETESKDAVVETDYDIEDDDSDISDSEISDEEREELDE